MMTSINKSFLTLITMRKHFHLGELKEGHWFAHFASNSPGIKANRFRSPRMIVVPSFGSSMSSGCFGAGWSSHIRLVLIFEAIIQFIIHQSSAEFLGFRDACNIPRRFDIRPSPQTCTTGRATASAATSRSIPQCTWWGPNLHLCLPNPSPRYRCSHHQ